LTGRVFRPRVVLIGVFHEQVLRGVNRWRPFYGDPWPVGKPRYQFAGDSLLLLPNPLAGGYAELLAAPERVLAEVGAGDDYYRTREHPGPLDGSPLVRITKLGLRLYRERGAMDADSRAMRLMLATLDRFVGAVEGDGAIPVVILFPAYRHMLRTVRVTAPIAAHARRRGYRVVDLHDAFPACAEDCVAENFAPQGHLSAIGNQRATAHLRSVLSDVLR
jgi:hypothetical protein